MTEMEKGYVKFVGYIVIVGHVTRYGLSEIHSKPSGNNEYLNHVKSAKVLGEE